MALIYRLDITKQNCNLCDHFRRNTDSLNDPNEGSCCRYAPRGRSSLTDLIAKQDNVNVQMTAPETTYCGEFRPFTQDPREVIVVVE